MTKTFETRGARIAWTENGTGPVPLVFLHYWGGSARTWDRVVDKLGPEIRSVALDQRGWGRSEALDGRYDLDAMADDVEDVIAKLGRVVLVGHSMGGKVAQIVAARGRSAIAGLVLVAPAPPVPMAVPAEARAGMLASYGSREGVEQAIGILAGRALTEDERERVIADTLAGAPGAKKAWTEHGMLATVGDGLRGFAGPVHVIVGEHDRVEHPDALRAAFANVLPRATFTVVPGAGHLLPLEAPAAIAAACRDVTSRLPAP